MKKIILWLVLLILVIYLFTQLGKGVSAQQPTNAAPADTTIVENGVTDTVQAQPSHGD